MFYCFRELYITEISVFRFTRTESRYNVIVYLLYLKRENNLVSRSLEFTTLNTTPKVPTVLTPKTQIVSYQTFKIMFLVMLGKQLMKFYCRVLGSTYGSAEYCMKIHTSATFYIYRNGFKKKC